MTNWKGYVTALGLGASVAAGCSQRTDTTTDQRTIPTVPVKPVNAQDQAQQGSNVTLTFNNGAQPFFAKTTSTQPVRIVQADGSIIECPPTSYVIVANTTVTTGGTTAGQDSAQSPSTETNSNTTGTTKAKANQDIRPNVDAKATLSTAPLGIVGTAAKEPTASAPSKAP